MRIFSIKTVVSICIVLSAVPTFAQYTCTGPVSGVSLGALDGAVIAATAGSLSWARFCSINTVANGIQPESCKAIYAMLLSAQASSRAVSLSFSDSGSCTSHPAWSYLDSFYFITIVQ